MARQQKGSSNWQKTKLQIQRIHNRIENQRKDHIHKMTAYLTTKYSFIAIEDLNVLAMLKNHSLALSISDASWSEIIRQLEYKSQRRGGVIQKVGRFFPSSKKCSNCGCRNDKLKLSQRIYHCINPECRLVIDRDLNAALNLLKEGLRLSKIS